VPDHYFVTVTIANALFATLFSSLVNMTTVIRQKLFYGKETLWVAISAVIIAFVVFETVVKSNLYSRNLFNGVVVCFMFIIIFQTFKKLKLSNVQNERVTKPKLLVTGGVAGTIASPTGLGGGTVIIPLLNLWLKVDIFKAKSISFGSIFAISLWLSINNLFLEPPNTIPASQGLIIIPLIIPIVIGVLIGSPLGVITSNKISARAVTLIFLAILSIVSIQKIAELVKLG
jgi:uncharacterized membrane protein YfcA